MIDILCYLGTEIIFVRINGNDIKFANSVHGNIWASIDGLKLSYIGVCREFPDLELRVDWKQEAIHRFKEKIKLMKDEEEVYQYLIKELNKMGYIPIKKMKAGFRPEAIHEWELH